MTNPKLIPELNTVYIKNLRPTLNSNPNPVSLMESGLEEILKEQMSHLCIAYLLLRAYKVAAIPLMITFTEVAIH